MLSVNILLGSWNLNLYIRLSLSVPTSDCLCLTTTINALLFIRAIKILMSRVHDLVCW